MPATKIEAGLITEDTACHKCNLLIPRGAAAILKEAPAAPGTPQETAKTRPRFFHQACAGD